MGSRHGRKFGNDRRSDRAARARRNFAPPAAADGADHLRARQRLLRFSRAIRSWRGDCPTAASRPCCSISSRQVKNKTGATSSISPCSVRAWAKPLAGRRHQVTSSDFRLACSGPARAPPRRSSPRRTNQDRSELSSRAEAARPRRRGSCSRQGGDAADCRRAGP